MEESGYIVYKHTNKINGKVYIGITRTNVELRWRSDGSGYVGVSKPAIVHCLKGKTKKAGGFKWKYKDE